MLTCYVYIISLFYHKTYLLKTNITKRARGHHRLYSVKVDNHRVVRSGTLSCIRTNSVNLVFMFTFCHSLLICRFNAHVVGAMTFPPQYTVHNFLSLHCSKSMGDKKKILSIGLVCLDIINVVDKYPEEDSDTRWELNILHGTLKPKCKMNVVFNMSIQHTVSSALA